MIIDAGSVPSGTILETEVCIVGAGAAGITLAREFIDSPFRVVLLESGGMDYEQETQDLYEGQSVGQTFDSLTTRRLRYVRRNDETSGAVGVCPTMRSILNRATSYPIPAGRSPNRISIRGTSALRKSASSDLTIIGHRVGALRRTRCRLHLPAPTSSARFCK